MAKATYLYFGNDSYGRAVETAMREDGQWFSRSYVFNGYAKAWSKWAKDNAPSFFNDKECEWGFKKLTFCPDSRVRLPNI